MLESELKNMSTAPPTFQPIIGAGLLGILLAAPLFGVYSVQVYHYFLKYPKDQIGLKALVYLLWIVLAAQYALNIHSIYGYLIHDFGHPDQLSRVDWDFIVYAIFDSVCAIAAQSFFAWRLYLIIKHSVLRWLCVAMILASSWLGFFAGSYLFSRGIKVEFFSKYVKLTWIADIWLGSTAACDIIIAVAMCASLHTSRTGVKRTDLLINKLMAYSIRTGAVTSIVQIFCLATGVTSGFHFGHIMVIFPLGPLYCISLLANLHARASNAPVVREHEVLSIGSTTINKFGSHGTSKASRFLAPSGSLVSGTDYDHELGTRDQSSMQEDIEMNRKAGF